MLSHAWSKSLFEIPAKKFGRYRNTFQSFKYLYVDIHFLISEVSNEAINVKVGLAYSRHWSLLSPRQIQNVSQQSSNFFFFFCFQKHVSETFFVTREKWNTLRRFPEFLCYVSVYLKIFRIQLSFFENFR